MCGAPLDDWLMLVHVDVLFTCGECGFNSLGSWSYLKEWVWKIRNLILQEFDINKRLPYDSQTNRMSVT